MTDETDRAIAVLKQFGLEDPVELEKILRVLSDVMEMYEDYTDDEEEFWISMGNLADLWWLEEQF